MSKTNVAAVLLAIYASKKLAECDSPTLRYGKDVHNCNTNTTSVPGKKSTFSRMVRTLRFILSLMGIRELGMIVSIAAALVGRSILRLKLLNLSTAVENSVLTGKKSSFWETIRTFSLYMIPTSACFAVFNYLLSELAIHVRNSTSTRLLSKFTTGRVYFQVVNAGQLQSITAHNPDTQEINIESYSNPDQILTNDIEHFSYALSGLFSHVMRPVVDIIVNAQRLYSTGGAYIPAVMGIYLVVTSNILNYIRSPVTVFTDGEQRLEGEYRSLIARIATSAEEIAALEGGKNEEVNVLKSMHPLLAYSRRFAQFRCNMSFVDVVVARYWLMILGWRLVGMHFFEKQGKGSSSDVAQGETIFRDYQNMSKTMLALSNAVGELIMSGRDVVKVFAYGEKLAEFEDALDTLIQQQQRTNEFMGQEIRDGDGIPCPGAVESKDDATLAPELHRAECAAAHSAEEEVCLALENVSIVPPNRSDPLYSSVNIVFRRKMHTIVTGENGTGKSSLLRVLAGVWPAGRGRVVRPPHTSSLSPSWRSTGNPVLYLPQKPYMSLGTLRQQIVYPDILPEEEGCGGPVLDAELLRILGLVHLAHLMDPSCFPLDMSGGNGPCVDAGTTKKGEAPEPTTLEIEAEVSSGLFGMVLVRQQKQLQRGYTLDSVVDWSEVLSGGEKQRLSLARLFYQRPVYALLDECTSAMSRDVEEALLSACLGETDTTLIAITHSPHLRTHFKYELNLSKQNRCTYQPIKKSK